MSTDPPDKPSKPDPQPTIMWNPNDPPDNDPAADEVDAGESAPEEDRLVGTVLKDKWKVLSKIGAGSFGSVYKVQDIKGGWTEALKVLAVDRLIGADADATRKRFLREAQIMKRLGTESQHIVGLATYEEDLEAGQMYFTMELVEGPSLAEVVLQEGPLPLERTIRIALQTCDALAVAHEGPDAVVHRDLKLENLMLTTDRAGNEIVKVLDFGIAKIAEKEHDSRLTTVGTLGTPGYAAPEQLRAEEVDGRTDLFAFGVILYSLLTGKDPWLGNTAGTSTHQIYELMVHTERGEVRPMSDTGVDVPPALERIVLQLLRRDPDERFASAQDLKAALQRVSTGAAASDSASLRVLTDEPGVGVQIRMGRRVVAEGPTPLTADGLEGGSYRVSVSDPGYETTSTSVAVESGALQDVTVVTAVRSAAADSRRRIFAAVAVLIIVGGTIVAHPWPVTISIQELDSRSGELVAVRLNAEGMEGRLSRGFLPSVRFQSAIPETERLGMVDMLRSAGHSVDASWEVDRLVAQAVGAQSQGRYFGAAGADVRSFAEKAVAFDPQNRAATSLLRKVAERMAWDAAANISDGSLETGRAIATECLSIVPDHRGCLAANGA